VQCASQNATLPYIVTERVREEARAHFGAPGALSALPGVPLENGGATGTRSSHWEARWLREDLMAGVKLSRSPFSRITQALLIDSGWYAPTGGQLTPAGGLRWGHAAGDAFVQASCMQRPLPAALLAGGWCDAETDTGPGCTPDKRATAFCGADSGGLHVRHLCLRCGSRMSALPCLTLRKRVTVCAQDGCTSWVGYGAPPAMQRTCIPLRCTAASSTHTASR
jgi:hypothetical protein